MSKPEVRKGMAQPRSSRRAAPDLFAGRIYGLDALRALAVVLVLIYHLVPSALPGGFLGVDVFFVVSGFLITGLLIKSWRRTRHVELRDFWVRRARRLLPALTAVVLVSSAIGGLIGGDVLVGIRRQILGALTFTSNWTSIAAGSSYGSDFNPELFTHLWSLAVEEQFYLVWPIVLLAVLVAAPRLRVAPLSALSRWRAQSSRPMLRVFVVAAAVAVVSATLMAVLANPATDPSRVYYGTDTHLVGLMMGAALAAFASSRIGARRIQRMRRSNYRKILGPLCLVLGVGTICLLASNLQWTDSATYRFGITLASGATVMVLAGLLVVPHAARRAERGLLVWVGVRSYGLYLYHWPVVVLFYYAAPGWSPWVGLPVMLAIILLVTALSYRYIEQPVRRLGFRACGIGAYRALTSIAPRRTRRAVAAIAAVAMLALAGTAHAVVRQPSLTDLDRQLAAGALLIDDLDDDPGDIEGEIGGQDAEPAGSEPGNAASGDDASGGGDSSVDGSAGAAGGAGRGEDDPQADDSGAQVAGDEPSEAHAPKVHAPRVVGRNVTIIGDSVTIAAAESLTDALPKVVISASVGRNMTEAPRVIDRLRKRGRLRPYVVVALGTNSTLNDSQLRRVMKAIGPGRGVVLVTGHADRSWIKPTNRVIRRAPGEYGNVAVADWDKVAKDHPDAFGPDGVHPAPDRTDIFAETVVAALGDVPPEAFKKEPVDE